jgi:predicted Rossmann fold nucleotide-binding protein DprA/Smf involved in DNA uptake
LNTAVRPVVDDSAQPLSPAELAAIAAFLGEKAEVIASFQHGRRGGPLCPPVFGPPCPSADQDLLNTLARRPMTARHLAQALGVPLAQVQARLARLQDLGLIVCDQYQDENFFHHRRLDSDQ